MATSLYFCAGCRTHQPEVAKFGDLINDSDFNPFFLCVECWGRGGREAGWLTEREPLGAAPQDWSADLVASLGVLQARRDELLMSEAEASAALATLEERLTLAREDAVFARGYRAGFFEASAGKTAFQGEVDEAHARWVEGGRRTHLEGG